MNILQINPQALQPKPRKDALKKVAAYARVSSAKESSTDSLLNQIDYFTHYIKSRPDWEFAGVFIDHGVSGTKTDRPGFLAMMEAARAGEIDLILTKSVARFSRNMLSLLISLRELKDLHIDVYFEEEHLHSISSEGELLLTLLAIKAEEEARNYSELAKLSVRKRFATGQYLHSSTIYGYKVVDGKYEIIPEEAAIVRRIFADFISGKGISTIAQELNAEGLKKTRLMKNRNPQAIWRYSTIERILKNETYTGNVLLQKSFIQDFRTKKRARNQGELDQYFVEQDHPAIISEATYTLATKEFLRREKAFAHVPFSDKIAGPSLFQQLLYCATCGSRYQRRVHVKNGKYRCTYNCSRSKVRFTGKTCKSPRIRESILIAKTKEVLGLDEPLTREILVDNLRRIEIASDHSLYFYLNGSNEPVITNWDLTHKDWGDEWKVLPEDLDPTVSNLERRS